MVPEWGYRWGGGGGAAVPAPPGLPGRLKSPLQSLQTCGSAGARACPPACCSLAMSAHSYYLQRLDKVEARFACLPACLPRCLRACLPRCLRACLPAHAMPAVRPPYPCSLPPLFAFLVHSIAPPPYPPCPPALSACLPAPLPALWQVRGLDPYVVHMTWTYNGIAGKRSRLRDMGMWVDPPEYYGSQGAASFLTVDITLPEVGAAACMGGRRGCAVPVAGKGVCA